MKKGWNTYKEDWDTCLKKHGIIAIRAVQDPLLEVNFSFLIILFDQLILQSICDFL